MNKYQLDLTGISVGSKIVLCGAGKVGSDYYDQLQEKGYKVVLWIDGDINKQLANEKIKSKKEICNAEYDYVVIAVQSALIVGEMFNELQNLQVDTAKIIWRRPQKIRYNYIYDDPFLRQIYQWRIKKFAEECQPMEALEADLKILENQYERIKKDGSFEPREWYINESRKIAYLHNAKVACTSLKASLRNIANTVEYPHVHQLLEDEKVLEIDGEKYFKYTFVRNPFSRLVSCYKSKYIVDKKVFGNFTSNLCYGRKRYLLGWLENVEDFDEFVEKVCQIPICWQERHFRAQYDLIYEEECLVDFVGKFEELPDSYRDICSRYDLQTLSHYNKSDTAEWEKYYTYETAMKVYKKFEKDIQVFGYEKEAKELLQRLK